MWFLRSVELDDGQWACRWGGREFDQHPLLEASLGHLEQLTGEIGPAELVVHRLDGRVLRLGDPEG
jgi:hypothetical protein